MRPERLTQYPKQDHGNPGRASVVSDSEKQKLTRTPDRPPPKRKAQPFDKR